MSLKIYVNGVERAIHSGKFPAGESLLCLPSILSSVREVQIRLDYRSNDDLINLLLLTDAIRRQWSEAKVSLNMPYFPYARQDRVCNSGESLSVKVIADLINSQNFSSVTCNNLHSDVAAALINNLNHYDLVDCARSLLICHPEAILVSPDAGANKKVYNFAKRYNFKDVVRADKTRNVATGEIVGTTVYSKNVGDRDFLILDDICDGGRTFIELAKALRPLTTGKIYLYVTHGIFSKGAEVFEGVLDGIYVSNLMGKAHPLIKEI